jgi:hypothetical protein
MEGIGAPFPVWLFNAARKLVLRIHKDLFARRIVNTFWKLSFTPSKPRIQTENLRCELNDYNVLQADVNTAFLDDVVDETIHIQQPPG